MKKNKKFAEKKSQDAKNYEELQKIIFAVKEVMKNTALLDNIKNEKEFEQVMPVLLASLGNYAQADRSYVLELKPTTTDILYMTHIWCKEGVFPVVTDEQEVPLKIVPNWYQTLNQGDAIAIYDWYENQEKYPEEYKIFSKRGIKSIILIPIMSAGIVVGYIGVDNPKHNRIELSMSLIKGISGHIGGLKENLYMMKKLEEKQISLEKSLKALNREKSILDALSVDYTAIYYCDFNNDRFIPLKCEEYNNAVEVAEKIKGKENSYSAFIRYYFEHFVIKESASDFLEKLDAEYLKEHLRKNERFAYKYRVRPNKMGQQYFEVQTVRLKEEDGYKAIMGYRYIDDLVAEQEKLQTKLENTLAEATLNSEIIGAISKIYWLIYRVNLTDKTYEEISAKQETHKLTGKQGYVADIYEKMNREIVADEYKLIMWEFWDISTLTQRLNDTDSIAAEYKTRTGSWNLARFIAKKRDSDGNVTHALYVVRNVEQEKQKEIEYKQQLMETAAEARRANMAKTDFLRRMSHDIRTPINGIQGMVSIAEHFPNDFEKQKECRCKIKESSAFLAELVNNILDMNKLESGAVVLEHKPFNLFDILHETDDITNMSAVNKGLHVYIDHTRIKHFHLIGSPLHLKQIFQNIAGNAAKYNRKGGSISFTAIEIQNTKNTAIYKFICSDTGCGMSEEFKLHAFEPFAQEDTSARTSYMGTGLGLPIVKQLVEMMGGTIVVESEKNVGSTFTVTLSFEIDTHYEEEQYPKQKFVKENLSGIKVLLVEDNELNMEIAKFILENSGMKVETASNGKEALDIFASSEEKEFDLILMDIMMPVMDGLTATKKIREMNRKDASQIPVFAMTANAFTDDIEESRKAGMNEHLSKPLDEDKMLDVIKRYVFR